MPKSPVRFFLIVMMLAAASLPAPAPPAAAAAQDKAPPAQPTPQTPQPTPQPTPQRQPGADAAPTPSPAPPPRDEDEAVERVETDLTNLLFTAIDKDRRFVTTLKPEDIRVVEDGVPQEVFTFQRETDRPLSLALLIDTSASQEAVLEDEQAAALAFINSVLRRGKDAASVVSFTGMPKLEQPFTDDTTKLREAIGRVRVEFGVDSPECDPEGPITEETKLRCSTGVWDSVALAAEQLLARTPEHTRRAVILLSDGDDTVSRLSRERAAEVAVKNNTVVYAIGIRDEDFEYGKLEKGPLRKISEQTGGRAFFPRDRAELTAAFAQIEQELRSQYLAAYSPSNKKRDGTLRRVQIEITNPALRKAKLRLLYRQGYYAK